MKIKHTTYDRSSSARRTRRHSEKNSADEERAVTTWPRTEAPPAEPQPEMTTYLMLEQRLEKEARKEQLTPESRDREAHRPKKQPAAIQASRPQPPLRRKPSFSESLRECLGSPKSTAQKHPEEKDQMTKIYTLRDAIRAGKLEQAVPPSIKPAINVF